MPSPWDEEIAEVQRRKAEKKGRVMERMQQWRHEQLKRAKRRAFFWGFFAAFFLDRLVHLIITGTWWVWS